MHIKAAGAVAPRVPVRSKADHFERDGAEQRQNTWQNRDLRPILPLEPTGLDGTPPQPLHCQSTSMAVHLAQLAVAHVPPAGPGRLGNGQPASKHALLTSE